MFLEVVSLSLRTSIAVPWVQVSNAFYVSLRSLKADNSGKLPSPLLVFRYFMSVNQLFGHFLGSFLEIYLSCKVAQGGEGKPTSFVGLAPSPV